jgi:dephospho-CoA kinase
MINSLTALRGRDVMNKNKWITSKQLRNIIFNADILLTVKFAD